MGPPPYFRRGHVCPALLPWSVVTILTERFPAGLDQTNDGEHADPDDDLADPAPRQPVSDKGTHRQANLDAQQRLPADCPGDPKKDCADEHSAQNRGNPMSVDAQSPVE